jgi:hypothetical protein
MQKKCKKLANCKTLTKLSNVFSKFSSKIKAALKPVAHSASVSKQKKKEEK